MNNEKTIDAQFEIIKLLEKQLHEKDIENKTLVQLIMSLFNKLDIVSPR